MKNGPALLVYSDDKGKIDIDPRLEGAGMEAGVFFRLTPDRLIKIPACTQLFTLPQRAPIGYDAGSGTFVTIDGHAVAAFLPPGYTSTYNSAYRELEIARPLPLFSYGTCAFYKNALYTTAIRVDRDSRHDSRFIDIRAVRENARRLTRLFRGNRVVSHLGTCALHYGCPGAQNFFLGRHEGPLPTAPYCNARCAGCISYQPKKGISATQPRIKFIPTPEEIAQVAIHHIRNVGDPVVSFGQGCEGEPLMAGAVIEKALRMIRNATNKGFININTNASSPRMVARLFDAGLESMRVSLNSAQELYYMRYYKPKGYAFGDVKRTIRAAKERGGFVSINYLTMPGFTDSHAEIRALKRFIEECGISMVQWRNLNFDPLEYFRILKIPAGRDKLTGIKELIESLKGSYPNLMMGYFNPSRSTIQRHGQ